MLKITCYVHKECGLTTCPTFKNFSANMFLFSVRKNPCTTSFLDAQKPYSWSTLKEMSVYFCIYLYENICLKDVVRVYLISNPIPIWGRVNNLLKANRCLGLVKCFTVFHFKWHFWEFNYFSVFWYFHLEH